MTTIFFSLLKMCIFLYPFNRTLKKFYPSEILIIGSKLNRKFLKESSIFWLNKSLTPWCENEKFWGIILKCKMFSYNIDKMVKIFQYIVDKKNQIFLFWTNRYFICTLIRLNRPRFVKNFHTLFSPVGFHSPPSICLNSHKVHKEENPGYVGKKMDTSTKPLT